MTKLAIANEHQHNPLVFASTFNPCVMLWLAVIAQAILEARAKDVKKSAPARAWLFSPANEPDFMGVCGLAHLDHFWVREQAQRYIDLPHLPLTSPQLATTLQASAEW